jgi:16S rRNA (guanine527-N7)-methyltransferase
MSDLRTTLQAGLQSLRLDLDARQVDLLLDYLGLLQKWNKVYNLTAVRDPAEMMTHHLLDSLAAIGPLLRQTQGRALHARVESLNALSGQGYDVVCSRAFASLVDFTNWSRGALAEGGLWMAMKGKHPADELDALNAAAPGVDVFHVEQLQVPALEAERCIVWMRPGPSLLPEHHSRRVAGA